MEYADNQGRLARLDNEIAEFDRIQESDSRDGRAETDQDAAFYSTHLVRMPQLREERKALESVMRANPGVGGL
jgi:hypothetical protein